MVDFLGTMAKWFQRNNDKNHITNEMKRRKTTRQSKEVMINQGSRYHMMSQSSRVRKPRRSHSELMKLPWRRMKVRKLEDERRSGATMVFGEALK